MTLNEFLSHWSITENPFRGEEARNDAVFVRMTGSGGLRGTGAKLVELQTDTLAFPPPSHPLASFHSDFDKVLGDLHRPSTSIVFGEKGSGKTAIRLQIAARVAQHNAEHPAARVLMVAYDDLNPFLARLHERVGGKTPLESFQQMRLVDHMDAILHTVVPRLVDAILGLRAQDDPIDLGADVKRVARRLDRYDVRDLLLLQALYDRPEQAEHRTAELRRRLGAWRSMSVVLGDTLVLVGPVMLAALFVWGRFFPPGWLTGDWPVYALTGLGALWLLFAIKHAVWDRFRLARTCGRIKRQLRVLSRSSRSWARSLRQLPAGCRDPEVLPIGETDEVRYSLFSRLRRLIGAFGYTGMLVVIDRVDEPTLVSGDADRMRAITWPLLNNKFLQQEGLGVKMLLPVELRHALFRESSAFFQDARLDKQNMIERLTWTGPMLYDLCNTRLQACRPAGSPQLALLDLFAEDVTRQDVVDALDQMHQPRDAFKFLYRCMTEHASNVTKDQNAWRIPKLTLDQIRKQEADRVQQLHRGIRPA